MKTNKQKNISIKNRKAFYEFEMITFYVAGIVLKGTEIKSIRQGNISFSDSFCMFDNGELFIKNFHISEYEYGTYLNHDTKRDRKLLLTKKELKQLNSKIKEKGLTIMPVKIFINEKGYAKMEIALCRGKKLYDKKESIKRKDLDREDFKKI